jgi:hypothetical protein
MCRIEMKKIDLGPALLLRGIKLQAFCPAEGDGEIRGKRFQLHKYSFRPHLFVSEA